MSSITRQALLTIISFTALALVLLLTVSAEAKELKFLKVPGSATPTASEGKDVKQRQIVVESNEGSTPTAKKLADATPKAKVPEATPQTDADDEDDGAQAADAPDDAAPQASAAADDDDDAAPQASADDDDDDTAEAAAATPAPIPLTRARHGYGYGYGYGYRPAYDGYRYRPAYDGCD